jgi:hypothetical protein
MIGGYLRVRQRDNERQRTEQGEQPRAELAELGVKRGRERENACAQNAVEREKGRSEKPMSRLRSSSRVCFIRATPSACGSLPERRLLATGY